MKTNDLKKAWNIVGKLFTEPTAPKKETKKATKKPVRR